MIEGREKVPSGPHVQIKVLQGETGGGTFIATFSAASAPKADKSSSKPFEKSILVPYWLVQYTDEQDRANMHRSTLKCTMSMTAGKDETSVDAVIIPILQNSKVVKPGDELLVFGDKLVKPAEYIEPAPKPDQPAPSSKKHTLTAAAKKSSQPKKKAMTR